MTRFSFKPRGYPTGSMPTEEKPYRVYRGGRTKGKVPLERPERARPDPNGRRPARAEDPQAAPALGLEATDRCRPPRAAGARDRVGDCGLSVLPQRSREGERTARQVGAACAREPERTAPLEPDDHAPARPRPREHRPARRPEQLRLDHDPAHRPEPPPARVPVDPARPARSDPGPRRGQDQRGVPARRRRRSRSARSRPSRGSRSTT